MIHAEIYAAMRTDDGCLPLEVQTIALVGLFSALEYLATVPMIHRDVKPVLFAKCILLFLIFRC